MGLLLVETSIRVPLKDVSALGVCTSFHPKRRLSASAMPLRNPWLSRRDDAVPRVVIRVGFCTRLPVSLSRPQPQSSYCVCPVVPLTATNARYSLYSQSRATTLEMPGAWLGLLASPPKGVSPQHQTEPSRLRAQVT